MKKTLREIADIVEGELCGDPKLCITGFAAIEEAGDGDLTFVNSVKYLRLLEESGASAVLIPLDLPEVSRPFIRVQNPSISFGKLIVELYPSQEGQVKGIHPTAIIGSNVTCGKDISVGPYVILGNNVRIGDGSVIYPHVYISAACEIGKNTVVYSNVSIREKTTIGNNVIIHSGAVIGKDGFGFDTAGGKHHKIPQVGRVVIEDDVEIGANVCIDRARFSKTVIGKGTKIDNLVQIAHNVIIGKYCLIAAEVGISGSAKIGDNAILAGQVGIAGHLKIGDNAIIGAQSGVTKSVAPNTFVSGYPAQPHRHARKLHAYVQRLPELFAEIKEIKKDITRKK